MTLDAFIQELFKNPGLAFYIFITFFFGLLITFKATDFLSNYLSLKGNATIKILSFCLYIGGFAGIIDFLSRVFVFSFIGKTAISSHPTISSDFFAIISGIILFLILFYSKKRYEEYGAKIFSYYLHKAIVSLSIILFMILTLNFIATNIPLIDIRSCIGFWCKTKALIFMVLDILIIIGYTIIVLHFVLKYLLNERKPHKTRKNKC